MPTKQITVCSTCRKVTCDGGIWKFVQTRRVRDGVVESLSKIPKENQQGCTLSFGLKHRKALAGKAVGDRVTLRFTNWVTPCDLTVEKIED